MPRVGSGRPLTRTGFERLLDALDPDPARAADEYERMRRALAKFFDWRGAWSPDDCADETLDRLCRKLDEGTAIEDLRAYARGIARLLLHERRRGPTFAVLDDAAAMAVDTSSEDDVEARQRACFDKCLDALPADARTVVLGYYTGDRRDKIANRRALAMTAAVSENALRSRVQRIRDRLEGCVRACAAAEGTHS
ncbi:MAG TPA: hypothetical protein VFA27_17500 [Vicinamibacterales bacterium]|nr:hypothetical protein [Vicinamibacterales bacterium]